MRREDLYRDVDKQILGDAMVSDEAVATLRHLCDTIGNRMAGSTGERRAGDYIREHFTRIGLDNVQVEAFPFLAWERKRKPVLRLTRPARASFASIALPYSPKTPKGGIDVEVVDVGDGLPEDFHRLRRQIRGRAVLTTSESPGYYHRWVHRAEKFALAVKHGAKAFLFVNHYDGLLAPTGSARFNKKAEVPALGLAKEDGARLLRLAAGQAPQVHIETFDRAFKAQGRNVCARLTGTEKPDEMIVVGGHYDGHDISQGADDNGSGIATILDTARLLAPHAGVLKRTVRFVCFSAEEVGLIGSQAYVRRHKAEMAKMRLMVNCDCIGHSRGKGLDFQGWDAAKPRLAAMAGEMGEGIPFASRPMPYSDHFNFMVEGVPCCNLGSIGGAPHGRGYGHTAADTFDKVSRADLREAASVLTRCLIRFANDRRWTLPHKSKADVRRILDRYELISVMKTEGTLPEALQ